MDFKKALEEFKKRLPFGWESSTSSVRVTLDVDIIEGLLSKEKPTTKTDKISDIVEPIDTVEV